MDSILEELYYGNINPSEKQFDRNSDYAKCIKIIADNEESLTASLCDEENHLFSELMKAQYQILITGERERFIEGFKLGVRFIMDTFLIPRDSPFKDICR